MNIFLLIIYVTLSTTGATLIKYGGSNKTTSLFNVPFVNTEISLISLLGIVIYGISFLTFVILLNKFDMSYLIPVATGAAYVMLMVSSVAVFSESFSLLKAIGCIMILAGVLLVVATGNNVVATP
jgi:multidrug transporter EmrE-like cation transporter